MSFGIIPPREIALETASPCLPSCKRNAELPPHTNSAHQTVSYVIQDFFLDEITANVVASAPDLRVPALVSSFGKVLHQYFAQEGAPSLLEDFIHGPEVRQALRNQFSSGPEGFVVATATALRRVQMKIQDYFGPQFCLHDVLQEEELDDDEDDETELIISRVASSFYDEHESNSEAMKEAALEQFDQFKVDIVDQVRAKISSRNYKGPEWRKSAVWRKQVRGSISELYDVAVEVFEEMVEESPFLLNLAMFLEDASSCINLVAATIKIGDDQGAIGLADTSGTVARLVRFCETPNAVSKLVEEIGERVVRREREEAAMRQKAVEVALAAKLKEAHPPPNGTATASTSAASSSSAPNNVNGSTPAKKKDDSFDVLMERSSALRRKGEIRDEREQAEKQIVDLQALLVKLAEEEKALEVTLALPNAAPAPPAPSTSKKAGPSSTNAASKPTDDSDSDDDMPPLEPISDDDTPAPSTSRPAPAAAKPSPTPSKPKAKAAPSSSKPAPKPTPAPVIDSDDDMPPLEPISDDEAPPAPSTSRPAPKTAKPSPGTPKPKGTPSKPKTTVNCTPKPAPKPKVDDSDDMPPLEPISDDETPAPAAASRAPPPPFTAASTKKAPTPASKAKAAPFKSVDDDDPPEVGLDDDSDSDMPPLEPIDSDGDDGDVTDASMPPLEGDSDSDDMPELISVSDDEKPTPKSKTSNKPTPKAKATPAAKPSQPVASSSKSKAGPTRSSSSSKPATAKPSPTSAIDLAFPAYSIPLDFDTHVPPDSFPNPSLLLSRLNTRQNPSDAFQDLNRLQVITCCPPHRCSGVEPILTNFDRLDELLTRLFKANVTVLDAMSYNRGSFTASRDIIVETLLFGLQSWDVGKKPVVLPMSLREALGLGSGPTSTHEFTRPSVVDGMLSVIRLLKSELNARCICELSTKLSALTTIVERQEALIPTALSDSSKLEPLSYAYWESWIEAESVSPSRMSTPKIWTGNAWRQKLKNYLPLIATGCERLFAQTGTQFLDPYFDVMTFLGGVRVYEEAHLLPEMDYYAYFSGPARNGQEAPLRHFSDLAVIAEAHMIAYEAPITVDKVVYLKVQADADFKAGKHLSAVYHYATQSMSEPTDSTLRTNSALALLKIGDKDSLQRAVSDCTIALYYDPKWSKAWYRRGQALARLEKWELALSDIEQALRLDPSNSSAKEEWAKIRAKLRERKGKGKAK